MSAETEDISRFWTWFAAHERRLRAMKDSQDALWDTALAELKRVKKGFAFEMSEEAKGSREFVITAQEGDRKLFGVVDAMVAAAPLLRGWTFVALKPAMGFDFTHSYEGVVYDPKAMWFLPLNLTDRPGDLGLRVGVPSLRELDQDAAEFAVTIILETGLGERERAADVQYVEVTRLPNDPAKEGYIELPDLAAYIAWRKRRNAQG
jgi:hypothetical protein